jgi:thiamine biosynthesis protein ThiC
MTDIRTHILTHCKVELIKQCMMYRASITLNKSEYARVRLTEDEAVEALVSMCEKSIKWMAAFKSIQNKTINKQP